MTSAQRIQHSYFGIVLSALLSLLMTASVFAQNQNTAEVAAPETKAKKVSYSNKWRLRFSGNAESDGVITLKFIPKEGETSVADTSIKNPQKE